LDAKTRRSLHNALGFFATQRVDLLHETPDQRLAIDMRGMGDADQEKKSNFLTRIEQDRLSTAQLDPEYGKAEGNNCESEHDLADCVRFWSLRLALAFAMGLQGRAAASASRSCPTDATAISVCAK
jgi:hypothetical protein